MLGKVVKLQLLLQLLPVNTAVKGRGGDFWKEMLLLPTVLSHPSVCWPLLPGAAIGNGLKP